MLERKERWRLLMVAVSPEVLLSTGHVLRNDQIGGDGCARTGGWVGETRAEGDCWKRDRKKDYLSLGISISHFPFWKANLGRHRGSNKLGRVASGNQDALPQ